MADYRPATCAYCNADTWCETRANGKPQCRACKIDRFYAEILYSPLGYKLMGWQRKVLRDLYGTMSLDDGRRRCQSAYILVAKKNGKSFLIGGLPIYHLLMEAEVKPEAYGAAAAKDQAGIVFKAAAQLVTAKNTDTADCLETACQQAAHQIKINVEEIVQAIARAVEDPAGTVSSCKDEFEQIAALCADAIEQCKEISGTEPDMEAERARACVRAIAATLQTPVPQ